MRFGAAGFLVRGKFSTMESQQNTDAVAFAKQKLEAQAKETQEKMGGAENSSVITAQVVVPSEVGKKSEEVSLRLILSRGI